MCHIYHNLKLVLCQCQSVVVVQLLCESHELLLDVPLSQAMNQVQNTELRRGRMKCYMFLRLAEIIWLICHACSCFAFKERVWHTTYTLVFLKSRFCNTTTVDCGSESDVCVCRSSSFKCFFSCKEMLFLSWIWPTSFVLVLPVIFWTFCQGHAWLKVFIQISCLYIYDVSKHTQQMHLLHFECPVLMWIVLCSGLSLLSCMNMCWPVFLIL